MTLEEATEEGVMVSHDEAVYEVTVKHQLSLDEFYAEFGGDDDHKGYEAAKVMAWMGY